MREVAIVQAKNGTLGYTTGKSKEYGEMESVIADNEMRDEMRTK